MKKHLSIFLLLIVPTFILSGCSVKRAYEQPPKKDISLLNPGIKRVALLSEFGRPIDSRKNSKGQRVDIFSFIQGYSKEVRTVRAIGHGVLSVGTIGLWEFLGSPIEEYNNGTKVLVKVEYTKDEIVDRVSYLSKK